MGLHDKELLELEEVFEDAFSRDECSDYEDGGTPYTCAALVEDKRIELCGALEDRMEALEAELERFPWLKEPYRVMNRYHGIIARAKAKTPRQLDRLWDEWVKADVLARSIGTTITR